jgi:hypothetical protein
MDADLDLKVKDIVAGQVKYTLPLGRKVDQRLVDDGVGSLLGPGEIRFLVDSLFPQYTCHGRVALGAYTDFNQMAMVRVYPYKDSLANPIEIWFDVPGNPAQETGASRSRNEIEIIGDLSALPPRSELQRIHELLKSRTVGQANAPKKPQGVASASVGLQKQVFQPLLQYTDASRRSEQRLHSEGDVAKLLRLLGDGVLGKATITETEGTGIQKSGAGASVYDCFCEPPPAVVYNTRISVHVQVDGRGLALSFEVPRHERSKICPKEEWNKRQLITISGPEEIVARITNHPDFARTCAELKTRNTAAIDIYEDKAFPTEFTITLARPVLQPRAELDGALKPADGDVSTLFGRIFEGKATVEKSEWKTVFVKSVSEELFEPSRWNNRLVVTVDVDDKRLAVSIEVPKARNETGVAQAELKARRVITIKGDPTLVAQVKDHPELDQIREELNRRLIAPAQTEIAAPAATQALKEPKPADTRTPGEIEEALKAKGFVRMRGRESVIHRDLGSPEPIQKSFSPRLDYGKPRPVFERPSKAPTAPLRRRW